MYSAFGLRMTSDISLPELQCSGDTLDQPDVEVILDDLSDYWTDPIFGRSYFGCVEQRIYLRVPEVAIFCIEEGRRIRVSPLPGADRDLLRLYLLGSCMGAILLQREILPLHGSAVVIEGKAYAFVGDSGAGKSTLAAAFLSRGYALLSDDVIAVSWDGQGTPVVLPSYPQQKLWQNSIVQLGMQPGKYDPLYQEVDKYAIPVSHQFHSGAIPLAGIFELVPEDRDLEIQPIEGLNRFHLLLANTYRNFFVRLLKKEQWHFSSSACILTHTDVFRISRPSAAFSAQQMTDLILEQIGRGVSTL